MAGWLLLTLGVASACWQSDSATFSRNWERDRRARIRGMRAATAQNERGRDLAGDELKRFLADTTHESDYDQAPGGRAMRYVERSYFGADGRFIYHNSLWAREPEGREGSRWWVDGPRLCIVNLDMKPEPNCYTIAVRSDGRPQFFIDAPGDESHGLLTSIPTRVERGRMPLP